MIHYDINKRMLCRNGVLKKADPSGVGWSAGPVFVLDGESK
jgi:hypothetical protein